MHRCLTALWTALTALGLVALSVFPAPAQVTYQLIDLGALAGGPSRAIDISPAGVVTGAYTVGGSTTACVWTPTAGGYAFKGLGLPGGYAYAQGFGANDAGQVAATAGGSWFESGELWSGSWKVLTGKTTQSEAMGIGAAGTVAGTSWTSNGFAAVIWQKDKQYVLPYPVSQNFSAQAMGVNDYGTVVGYNGNDRREPTVGINDKGQICGVASVTAADGTVTTHAFVLTPLP